MRNRTNNLLERIQSSLGNIEHNVELLKDRTGNKSCSTSEPIETTEMTPTPPTRRFKRFKLIDKWVNFAQAQDECTNDGKALATIASLYENQEAYRTALTTYGKTY